jgi:hypothetical protein
MFKGRAVPHLGERGVAVIRPEGANQFAPAIPATPARVVPIYYIFGNLNYEYPTKVWQVWHWIKAKEVGQQIAAIPRAIPLSKVWQVGQQKPRREVT